jgi:hypothetical protein
VPAIGKFGSESIRQAMKSLLPVVAFCLLLLFISAKPDQQKFDKITVREFELVDEKGIQRASIKVEDGGDVVLRLFDQEHAIRVKVAANTDGSGVVLLDGDTNPGVHILSKQGGKMNVQDATGKKREL